LNLAHTISTNVGCRNSTIIKYSPAYRWFAEPSWPNDFGAVLLVVLEHSIGCTGESISVANAGIGIDRQHVRPGIEVFLPCGSKLVLIASDQRWKYSVALKLKAAVGSDMATGSAPRTKPLMLKRTRRLRSRQIVSWSKIPAKPLLFAADQLDDRQNNDRAMAVPY